MKALLCCLGTLVLVLGFSLATPTTAAGDNPMAPIGEDPTTYSPDPCPWPYPDGGGDGAHARIAGVEASVESLVFWVQRALRIVVVR